MPIARYFLLVGGVLLALLFASDAFVTQEPVANAIASAAPIDNPNPTVRIRSDRKWPERVVYDTSIPTIVPPKVEIAVAVEAPAPVAAPVPEMPAALVRESFAQLKTAVDPKPEARAVPKRKVAKARPARLAPPTPMMRVAQQPQFGFFGNNMW